MASTSMGAPYFKRNADAEANHEKRDAEPYYYYYKRDADASPEPYYYYYK
ncbi:9485_t:CDS:2, partial [Acaulospora colombiana]